MGKITVDLILFFSLLIKIIGEVTTLATLCEYLIH